MLAAIASAQSLQGPLSSYGRGSLENEVLDLALTRGSTRVATYNCLHTFEPYVGDWHQDVAQ